jgi:hypothetical protein
VNRVAEGAQLARRDAVGGDLAGQALDVAHAVERLAQCGALHRGAAQRADRVEAPIDLLHGDQGCENPLPEQPRAHRGQRAVEHRQQRPFFLTSLP